ncbi:MAG: thioredoxin [Clostridiales bacterium]|nr:thioredoxin [Clostridiales bacterium]
MPIITVTKENFKTEVEGSDKPVLVDFWAPWCGYCKRIMPVVDTVASSYADKLVVGKLNVDDNEELEDRFEVMTIPTLLLFKDGNAGEPLVNPGSRAEIDKWLSEQGVK